MNHPNLPPRYRTLQAGDAMTPQAEPPSHAASVAFALGSFGLLLGMYYLSSSQLKIDRAARARRNPRRRR